MINIIRFMLCSMCLSGCEIICEDRGAIVDKSEIDHIRGRLGHIHQEEVRDLLGPPSCVCSYDPSTWYYMKNSIQNQAFFHPDIPATQAYAVCFNAEGIAISVEEAFGPKSISICSDTTPLPSAHGSRILENMFRNINKIKPGVQAPLPRL